MDNIEIWVQLTERHTAWSNPEEVVKLRARGLKALLDQSYECGMENVAAKERAAFERGFSMAQKLTPKKSESSDYDDIMKSFSGLWGSKKS